MFRRRRAQQIAIEAGARLEQVDERELWAETKLERDIAELHVKIDQAHLTPERRLLLGEADCELAEQRRSSDPAHALDDAHQLRIARRSGIGRPAEPLLERRERRLELIDADWKRDDIVRSGADQRSNQG